MTKAKLMGGLLAVMLAGGVSGMAPAETAVGEDAGAQRPPWGDGPPPWVKDGKVDEAARKAYLAGRAAAGAAADPARPAADATPEERRAYWQKRAAERQTAAKCGGADTGGQGGGQPHAGARPAEQGAALAAPANASRRGGGGARDALLWLTDVPPKRDGRPGGWRGAANRPAGGGMAGMAGMAEGNPGEVPSKRVWLRMGNNPQTARPATGEETALLLAPGGRSAELAVEPHGGPYNVAFPAPELGYYNVYLIRRSLDQDTLNVIAAKVETARGAMGHGSGGDAALVRPMLDQRVPVEIVRERKDKEALFTRINYGDEVSFQVLRGGKPVQNARVTYTSGQGWSNSVQSDEDGRAAFTVIRDYYPQEWRLFDKRHRETYLVAASFAAPEAGEYQGGKYVQTRYTATLSGAYYPGVADYESYASGLMIGMAGLLFTGSSVWWYRRRRVKPYREVRFDD